MAAAFVQLCSRGLGRPIKVGAEAFVEFGGLAEGFGQGGVGMDGAR